MADVIAMSATWLLHRQDANFDDRADLNHDGVVNNIDADILAGNWKVIQQNAVRCYYHGVYPRESGERLGSVTAISDKEGKTVETYQYSVFGETRIFSTNYELRTVSMYGNPYMFTARRLDTETQLYYYRARMYAPHLGRFLQTDPIGYEDSMCLYLYVHNNPLIWIDPSGENAFGGFVSWIAGNGWDNSYNMGASEAGQLAKAAGQGALDGAEIYAGQWAELANDVTFRKIDAIGNYVERADRIASDYGTVGKLSQAAGWVSREAALAAVTPNFGKWAKNIPMYELGQTTTARAMYQSLSAIDRGKKMVQAAGGGLKGALRVATSTKWSQMVVGGKTLLTGPTPGGWYGLRGTIYGINELGEWWQGDNEYGTGGGK